MAAGLAATGTLDAQAADSAGLLSVGRIATLPRPQRQAWEHYLETARPSARASESIDPSRVRAVASSDAQAFARGVERIVRAQFPNGCWPAAWPLRGGEADAATFRDGAMLGVMNLLRETARGNFRIPDGVRRSAEESFWRGIDCIVDSQVVVDGRRAGWAARHDPLTLAPLREHPAPFAGLRAEESAGLLGLLVQVEYEDARVSSAARGVAAWLRETMLWGYAPGPRGTLAATPAAGPLWARVYEPAGNRPMLALADGTVRADVRALADSTGASTWFTDAPAAALTWYDAWAEARGVKPLPPAHYRLDAVVDARHTGAEGARVAGTPTYRTIGAALGAAPGDGHAAFVIFVRDGRYREKLSIQKPNIHLIGESRDGTVLTYDVAAGHISPGGWPYGTRGSWTLHVAAPGFRLERMTVENAFDFMGNAAKPDSDSTKLRGTQAVAVMLDEGSDRAVFRDCRLSGHQDTLFPNAGRSYFQRCEILGSVDFIFGAGRAVFDDCDIVSRDRGSVRNNGYITAPSTRISQPYGFVFVRSRLRKETPGMAPNSVTLGRPWHPSGRPDAIGSAVFIDTWMDDHVGATGWSPMNSTDAAGRVVEHQPQDARFFEYGSSGPGAVASPSRRVLTPEQAAEYTIARVLGGWDPRP